MKHILLSIILAAFSLAMPAQDKTNLSFSTRSDTDASLSNGRSAVVFTASNDNFIIQAVSKADKVLPTRMLQNGKYATEVVCDLSNGDVNHSFKVIIKGTSLGDYVKVALASSKRFYVDITQTIAHNLYFEYPNTQRAYTVNGKSAIEFSVPDYVEGVVVTCSEGIGNVDRTSAQGLNIFTLELDCAALKKLISDISAKSAEAQKKIKAAQDAIEAQKKYEDENMEKEGFDFDAADKKREKLDADLENAFQYERDNVPALFVSLLANKSNVVPVDIERIKQLTEPKQKLQINVIDGMHVETVFATHCQQIIDQARREYRQRKYNAAAISYREAANDASATDYDKETCLRNAEEMDRYSKLKEAANNQVRTINSYKKQGGMIDYNKLEENYNAAIRNFRSLFDETQDEWYQNMINKLAAARDGLGQVIVGTTTKGGYHQGKGDTEVVNAVDIYAINYYRKLDDLKEGTHGTKVGSVNEDGTFHVQLEKGKYKGLLFVPRPETKIKKNEYYRLDGNKHMKLRVNFYK